MTIIRRLIIGEWFKFFASSTVVLFLLITIANLISGFLRMNVTPLEVVFNHLLEIPTHMQLILPISCLVASLFSINKFKNRNELTAIFASGYSRKKFIFDLLIASSFIAIVQFVTSSFIQPFAKSYRHILIENGEHKFRNLKSKGLRTNTLASGKIWYKSGNYFFSFAAFDKTSNTLTDVNMYVYDNNYLLQKKYISPQVEYITDKGWISTTQTLISELNNDKFPKVSKKSFVPLPLNETPSDFQQIDADITTLDIISLHRYIKKLDFSGINTDEYKVIIYSKISTSIICIIFCLIASIAIFNPNRRNSSFGKNIAIIFVFTLLYWLVNSYTIELGSSSKLSPFLACFSVPILFSIYMLIFFIKNKKLSK